MMADRRKAGKDGMRPPEKLNLLLFSSASVASAACLWMASHALGWIPMLLAAWIFSFNANTLFSLLHEAVHGSFSARLPINEWAGRAASAWFPTGLSVQRAFHLTHHRCNRSRFEQFDVLHPGDKAWLKYAQWYSIYTGLYWAFAVAAAALFTLVPGSHRWRALRDRKDPDAVQTGSAVYAEALEGAPPIRARLEILSSFAFQAFLFWSLDLSLRGWAACYAAFALQWSWLQYTDHAFSPLNANHGAWNLRVGPLGRAFFLDYHLHLAHHQHPHAPWNRLRHLIDPASPRPSFFQVFRKAVTGPRREGEFPDFAVARGPGFLALAEAEAMCFGDFFRFGLRHIRYWGLAAVILVDSLRGWRSRRPLRLGFAFLQRMDDMLDGHRPAPREPLEIARSLAAAIRGGAGDARDAALIRMARLLAADLGALAGEEGPGKLAEILDVMAQDRQRVMQGAIWDNEELHRHFRRTFRLSLDLLLMARGSDLRSGDLPELADALSWCSVARDLREDLRGGLINIPREVLDEVRAEGRTPPFGAAAADDARVKAWLAEEHVRAAGLLDRLEGNLALLEALRRDADRGRGLLPLRMFTRSIRDYHRRRFPRMYRANRLQPIARQPAAA
jgi:fatty acid desaturase/phytoene/squalene synthetase